MLSENALMYIVVLFIIVLFLRILPLKKIFESISPIKQIEAFVNPLVGLGLETEKKEKTKEIPLDPWLSTRILGLSYDTRVPELLNHLVFEDADIETKLGDIYKTE